MNVKYDDYENVTVSRTMSASEYCICDFCHRTGRVLKLVIPDTKYHNGYHLTTLYKQMWICESCRDKLRAAIDLEYPKGAENADT